MVSFVHASFVSLGNGVERCVAASGPAVDVGPGVSSLVVIWTGSQRKALLADGVLWPVVTPVNRLRCLVCASWWSECW